jgi:L-threonylcarbamoyladenylate synthase
MQVCDQNGQQKNYPMKFITSMPEAWDMLRDGKILAYPTEAVYGLGCDPFNTRAVEKLLNIKQRKADKGLIVLIANWEQLASLTLPIAENFMQPVRESWPGPITWIFPKSKKVLSSISGDSNTIALRMSAHPVARSLCAHQPVVSTSANLSGQAPARSRDEIEAQFHDVIDGLLEGELGGAINPSQIFDVCTGKRLR